jgi:hypothetical protein
MSEISPNTLNPRSPNSANVAEELLENIETAAHREPAPGEPPIPQEPPLPGDPPGFPPAPQAGPR